MPSCSPTTPGAAASNQPTPSSTTTVGTDSVSSEATCGAQGNTHTADESDKCLQDKDAKSTTVDQDETVRFGVDPDVADKHWTILMNGQQLVEDSNKTYRTVPGSVLFNAQYGAQGNSTNVAVAARDGKDDSQNITGVWVFKLKKD
ncbi:hypothetical protein SVIOM342S_08593 [Streptomyces violaceorubidus]